MRPVLRTTGCSSDWFSCGFRCLHVSGVFAEARFAVAPGTMMEGLLRSSYVRHLAFPRFEHGSLQGAAVRKTQLPRQTLQTIHCVEMFGGLLIALTTGEKHKTGHSCRHNALHAAHSSFSDFLHGSLLRTFFSRKHHVWFQ